MPFIFYVNFLLRKVFKLWSWIYNPNNNRYMEIIESMENCLVSRCDTIEKKLVFVFPYIFDIGIGTFVSWIRRFISSRLTTITIKGHNYNIYFIIISVSFKGNDYPALFLLHNNATTRLWGWLYLCQESPRR